MYRKFIETAVLGAALLAGAPTFAQQAPQGSAEAGKATFNKACYTCHGTTGQGAAGTGPRIGPTSLPFDAFLHQVRQPANQMAPFAPNLLSDQDVADIYAFLQAQKKEDYRQIPLLSNLQ
jgi:mono/diheme cytochrome c family protein